MRRFYLIRWLIRINILREAHAGVLMNLVASHGMTVAGSGFAAPNSGVVDQAASKWVGLGPIIAH